MESTTGSHVLAILDALERAGVEAWVGGGWGIDALAGRETREHSDLDVCVREDDDERARQALASIGFELVADERPTRFLMAAPGLGAADVHPLRIFPDGSARLRGPDGVDFDFAPGSLDGMGSIGGRHVRCFTAERQRAAHAGYEPRDADLSDLAILDGLTG